MLCDSEVCNRAWLEQIGKGPSARFSTVEKMKMTPEEWARRNNPGPGQYNLTEEAKIEAMALQVRVAGSCGCDSTARCVIIARVWLGWYRRTRC